MAERAYAALESYVFSSEAKEDRERYERRHAFLQDRYDRANTNDRMGFDAVRPPERFKPPIVWGEPRSWDHS